MKTKLFSITKDDLQWEYFRPSGHGGQKMQKTSSACRVRHVESGAVGECRQFRNQRQNRVGAFRRMATSDTFQKWIRKKALGMGKCGSYQPDLSLLPGNTRYEYCIDQPGHSGEHTWKEVECKNGQVEE
jgi:hypothetical protein